MKHLIVGFGEVGNGVFQVLSEHEGNIMFIHDPEKGHDFDGEVDVVHICIPPIDKFNEIVIEWKKHAPLVIVHSTVAIGTCDALSVVHSPIRGVHPEMKEGIKTFVKYFGGKQAEEAANIFSEIGIKVRIFPEARITEAIKLWDTTQYGVQIMIEKNIYQWCEENGFDIEDIYRTPNKDYNEGYVALGRPEVVRPYLKHYPGLIGGHCIVPNAKILGVGDFDEEVRKIEPNA